MKKDRHSITDAALNSTRMIGASVNGSLLLLLVYRVKVVVNSTLCGQRDESHLELNYGQ